MKAYRPTAPFNVAMKLLIPTSTNTQGVKSKSFTEISKATVFFGSFRTFGGTETTVDDAYTLLDTATIDCWYSPDIKADCRIYVIETAATYEIIGQPEDINMWHQYMRFKVRKVGGKA